MANINKLCTSVLIILILTACTTELPIDVKKPSNKINESGEDQAQNFDLALGMIERWEGEHYTVPSTLPTAGTADYVGYIVLEATGLSTLGIMSLTTDFGNSTISGFANNFTNYSGTSVTGTLNVTEGIIDPSADPASEFTFAADIDGDLVVGSTTHSIDAEIEGDFAGTNFGALIGVVVGQDLVSNSSFALSGAFVAEK